MRYCIHGMHFRNSWWSWFVTIHEDECTIIYIISYYSYSYLLCFPENDLLLSTININFCSIIIFVTPCICVLPRKFKLYQHFCDSRIHVCFPENLTFLWPPACIHVSFPENLTFFVTPACMYVHCFPNPST